MEFLDKHSIAIALFGCLLFSIGLHYKKEGKEIKMGSLGFATNLNWKGKTFFYIGLILFAQYIFLH